MSRRKRSLSSLFCVSTSHSRQQSGEISSASTMRIVSFSHSLPNSHLKSTSLMPTPRNRPDRKSLMRSASDITSSISWGVAQPIVLVIELDDRPRQGGALVDAEPGRQRPCGDVAHHHLERDDLDLADQ